MKWHVTIETKTRWSVLRTFDQHLSPTASQIVRDLNDAFPAMRDALRKELVAQVRAGRFVASPEAAFVADLGTRRC